MIAPSKRQSRFKVMDTLAESINVGSEWMIDARGCYAGALADLGRVRSLCELIIREQDLKVIGEGQWHQFPAPGGVTGLYLLTESHLACHTYPEIGIATFNLYCCRPRPRWGWEMRLREALGASEVIVRFVNRNTESESDSLILNSTGETVNPSAAREVANS